MIIYNVEDGLIVANIPDGQPYDYLEGNNTHITLEDCPSDWYNYMVVNGVMIKLSDLEMKEIGRYGKILTEVDRLEHERLYKLEPSYDEIKKAENTVEILLLLQEVEVL